MSGSSESASTKHGNQFSSSPAVVPESIRESLKLAAAVTVPQDVAKRIEESRQKARAIRDQYEANQRAKNQTKPLNKAPSGVAAPPQDSMSKPTKKRANAGNIAKPPAKRTKVRKPLDFEKLVDRAWVLMNKSSSWVKAQEGLEKMAKQILEEFGIVGDLEVKHTALLTLGEIVDQIYNAEPSRKAKEVRNGSAPPSLNAAMISIVEDMSVSERAAFIESEEGVEWKKNAEIPKAYGGFWFGRPVDDLMELFGIKEDGTDVDGTSGSP